MPAFLLAAPIEGFAETQLHFKQLAGPPAEIHDMAPADPAEAAIRSRSALLPVTLEKDEGGRWIWRSEIPVEGEALRFALISGESSWDVTFRTPEAKRVLSAEALGARRRRLEIGLSESGAPADLFELHSLTRGKKLQFSITSREPGRGFLLIEGAGPVRLLSHQAAFNQRVGQRIGVIAKVYDQEKGKDAPGGGRVISAALRVTTPDQRVLVQGMADDGLHGDGLAGDGVYGGEFPADMPGNFVAQVVVSGRDGLRGEFVRTAEHLIPIVEDNLSLRGQVASGEMRSEHRLGIRLGVAAPEDGRHYRVIAEVWGTGASGAEDRIPVAWIGGMAAVRDGALDLGLDTRWIAMAGARPPFELRNTRIEDPDHFITLATAERIPLPVPELPDLGLRADRIEVDEEMLMGPRPPGFDREAGGVRLLTSEAYTSGTGHKLLLVHGYCSSDVWGPVSGQFSNAAVFLDLGQNRSHDAFAQRILSFGQTWNSYAIVAHSQGGAAALQLYANYWSGLDNAGPGRLIQSVGTPYKGTNLAGILGSIGSWFGVGCGSNTDLTYSGAASWLAGIPSSYRAKVNYFTTSFTDNFGYDYCSGADLFLTDPDDGITEKDWGQLSGGVNQGHKTGWCHSVNMRDPAQYTDSSRNSSMSSNAAVGCYPLTRTHTGSGSDPVATPGSSTGCATGRYVAGATIQLQATPSAGYKVASWSGTNNNSSTSTSNTVTMPAGARTVSVNYQVIPPTCYALTRTHTGSGSDPVATPGNSSGCSAGQYLAGATIQLQATPSSGYQVASWSGTNNNTSTSTSNSVTMPAGARTVAVNYQLIPPTCYALTRTHTGSGSDPVATPGNSSGCSAGRYVAGATIQLQASPSTGHMVASWSGTNNNSSTSTSNSVTMPAGARTVTVNYQAIPPTCYALTRTHTGSGSDPVATPGNSSGCSAGQYLAGTTIQLQASPSTGHMVASWSGTNNNSSTSTSNSVTMPAGARTVTVNYQAIPPTCYALTRTHTGSGLDPVATPGNSSGCSAGQYLAGTTIQLQATPSAGHVVASWSGTNNNSSTSTTNSVTMPASSRVVSVSYTPSSGGGGDIQLSNGVPHSSTLPAGAQQSVWQYFYFDVTSGATGLAVTLDNLSEDADLYVRFNAKPDLSSFDCRPFVGGTSSESCNPSTATAGRWWVGVVNFAAGTPISFRVRATWTSSAGDFFTLTPCRLFDTRNGGGSPWADGSSWEVGIAGFCGVPATAKAISANVTVIGATAGGVLVFWPAQTPFPITNNISFAAGLARANNTILVTAPGHFGNPVAVWVAPLLNTPGSVHVIVDVNGYFQ